MSSPGKIPPESAIEKVVETAVYGDDQEAMEEFYHDLLGLELLSRQTGRHSFFRAGAGVLLIFRTEETEKGDLLPAHGARGAGHFALGIPTTSLDYWRRRLNQHGVAVEKEIDWPAGGKSIYFRDPAGNSVELITRGVWGVDDGW